jgi:hypothetical protein
MYANRDNMRYISILSILLTVLLLGAGFKSIETKYSIAATTNTTNTTNTIPAYEIMTRGFLNDLWQGVNDMGYGNKYQLLDIRNLNSTCPQEVAIIVHGWFVDEKQAKERFDRAKTSLENNTYNNISLVGFSWQSDMPWIAAKLVAKAKTC